MALQQLFILLFSIQMTSLFDTIDSAFTKTSEDSSTISELLLIQKQDILIDELAKNINNVRSKKLQAQVSDLSFDLPQKINHNDFTMPSFSSRRIFSMRRIEDIEVEDALSEIQMKCSRETFYNIREKLTGKKQRRCEFLLNKEKRHSMELMKQIARLKLKIEEYDIRLKNSEKSKVDESFVLRKQKSLNENIPLDKYQSLIKWEKSLIYQEKVLSTAHKKFNQYLNFIQEEKENLQSLNILVEKNLGQIGLGQKQSQCDRKCWQRQIFEKYQSNVNTRKRILSSQEENIESHYLEIKEIVNKVKQVALNGL